MADKVAMELKIKGLEKSMGTMVKMFKEFKASMDALEKKVNKNHEEEIQELVKTQKMLNDLVVTNSEAIKRIDVEIEGLDKESKKKEVNDRDIKEKRCKFFNRGYCRYKLECRFAHPGEVCKMYLEGKRCNDKSCSDRHPKVCKWWLQGKCRRNYCEYLHVTLVLDDDKRKDAHKFFPCYGCKNWYDDKTCVVQYMVQNTTLYLCLNCDSWIQMKDKILTPGWSLFDQHGNLRKDV